MDAGGRAGGKVGGSDTGPGRTLAGYAQPRVRSETTPQPKASGRAARAMWSRTPLTNLASFPAG